MSFSEYDSGVNQSQNESLTNNFFPIFYFENRIVEVNKT